MVAARCAIAVSRPIAEAGTGARVAAAERPQPAAASTDASAAAPVSTVSARAAGRVVLSGCIASPVPLSVGRPPRPAGCDSDAALFWRRPLDDRGDGAR